MKTHKNLFQSARLWPDTLPIFVTELSLKTVDLFQLPQQSKQEADARILTGAQSSVFHLWELVLVRIRGGGGGDEDADIPNYPGRERGTEELRDK